ncbi:MAG: hypothetical protein QOE26_216 [Verrucomicrobiota bacterium]|jgi:hypothetical protein
MKRLCITLPLCLVLSGGFASAIHAGKPKQTQPKDEATEPSKRRPHRGMAKAEIHKWYGDADDIRVSSHGEIWFYFFNRGHYFIPYYFGKPRTATFTFNRAGILTDFEYNQEN